MLGIDEKFTHTMFDLPYPNLIAGMRCPGGFDGFEDNANDNWSDSIVSLRCHGPE